MESLFKRLKFSGMFFDFSSRTGRHTIFLMEGCYAPCVQAYPFFYIFCAQSVLL